MIKNIQYLSMEGKFFSFQYSIKDEHGFVREFYCQLDRRIFIDLKYASSEDSNADFTIESELLFNLTDDRKKELISRIYDCLIDNFKTVARSKKIWFRYIDFKLEVASTEQITPKIPEGLGLPIDVVHIASVNKIKVIKFPKIDYEGMFFFDRKTFVPTIHVNGSDPEVRQRFTIAHELGHYFLGHNDAYRDVYTSNGYHNQDEKLANNFAAEILMPKDKVEYYMDQLIIKNMSHLARIFNVSKEALLIRLGKLGYGKY